MSCVRSPERTARTRATRVPAVDRCQLLSPSKQPSKKAIRFRRNPQSKTKFHGFGLQTCGIDREIPQMAGKPIKRARVLAEALRANGIDPDNLTTPAPPTAPRSVPNVQTLDTDPPRARVHAREERQPTPIRTAGPSGAHTRSAVDRQTADDLDRLAQQLRPGLTVRIERTRPTWAAGWIEDMPLDDHDLAAVLEYVSAEHGGQTYRASVISHEGAILYSSRLCIAGPPRRRGRVMNRDAWDGTAEPERQPERHQEHRDAPINLVELFTVISRQQAEARAEQAEANRQRDTQIDRLVASLLADRRLQAAPPPPPPPPPSLRDQLREVVEATQAVDEIREALTVDTPPPRERQRSAMTGIIEQAAGAMLAQGMANDQARRQAAPQQQQPPPQRQRRIVQEHRAPPPPQRPAPTRPEEPRQ